jgi:hypothetical protein
MSGVRVRACTAQVSTGTSLKTIMQIIAASNHRIVVPQISVSFEGITVTDAPIQVDIYRQTTGGTMTSLTMVKDNEGDDETIQTTATHTATVEPTKTSLLASKFVHPQGRADFGPFTVIGGGRIGVLVTAGVSVDCIVSAMIEE